MKKIILVLSITFIISTFSACKNSTTTESSSELDTSKVVAVTTTSETEKVAETNAVTSETQSQIETSPESVSEKKLNLDLLSDTELTYSQLQEKYGELIDVFGESGGRYYKFENGLGAFGWPGEGDSVDYERGYFNLPRSEENEDLTSGKFPYPKSHIACGYIIDLQATDIFIGLEQPATISEIVESYNIEFEKIYSNVDEESGEYMGPIEYRNKDGEVFRYSAVFIYEGKSIIIEMLNEDLISLDSYVKIRYKY